MRVTFSSLCYVILAWFSLLSSVGVYASERPLTVAVTQSNLMPLKWEQDGQYVGPMIELVKELSARSDVKMKIIAQPLARTLRMIEKGAIDGGFGNYKKADRLKIASFFDPPLAFLEVGVFAHKDHQATVNKLPDLRNKTIIKMNGHSINADFDQAEKDGFFKTVQVYDYESMVDMLYLGRADFAVGPSAAISQIIKEKGYTKDLNQGDLVFSRRPIYFYLSKQSPKAQQPEVLKRLQGAMNEMCRDGSYEFYTGVTECDWGKAE